MKTIFIAPNGRLYIEYTRFFKAYFEIEGISITELYCDTYALNLKDNNQVLFPGDMCSPFPFAVVEHKEQEQKFLEKGGGFRLDFNTSK